VRVEAATPKIDVNVPQLAPPTVQVAAAAPKVDIHIPVGPAPTVNVNTPPLAPPNITVNPPAPNVTIIDRQIEKPAEKPALAEAAPKVAAHASALKVEPAPTAVSTPADSVVPIETAKPSLPAAPPAAPPPAVGPKVEPTPAKAKAVEAAPPTPEPTIDNLYQYATRYVELYCTKHGMDPLAEARRWNKVWQAGVEQSISDNIDSSEQSYINRIVIAKRDYFNLATATPDKIVEACRILLRYRDGQLSWLQAMKDALTNENLRKTMTLLAAGP
jgi:hypothetical protein